MWSKYQMEKTSNQRPDIDLTEQARVALIRTTIRHRSDELKQAYPWLEHQNIIGMTILIFSVLGIVATAGLYFIGLVSAWVCIPIVAIFTSLLHELEHDLIHKQYFKHNAFVHNLMLLIVWIFRPGTINPWIRRKLHFLHHKTSGTPADIEERGIGNGRHIGLMRLFIMMDTFVGNILNALINGPKGARGIHILKIIIVNAPFAILCAITWYGFLVFHVMNSIGEWAWSAQTLNVMNYVDNLVVVLIAPFYLRSFCLNFISSNMHYYGDVKTLSQQTQVLNAWFLLPFQLFCFNFGSTHGIHHFVVGQPFYLRQLTAPAAHRVMRTQGIRFNDLGTFWRANRFQLNPQPSFMKSKIERPLS